MAFTMMILEEREDERWLLQRALSHAHLLVNAASIWPSAADALDYFSGKGEFVDRAHFPVPETIVIPGTLESMRSSTFIRKLAPFRLAWNGRIVLLCASTQHPEAVAAAKLGAIVLQRPFTVTELA